MLMESALPVLRRQGDLYYLNLSRDQKSLNVVTENKETMAGMEHV